jgi:hypothetical protein
MWTLAASVTIKYQNLHELFYARARKYAELMEMSGHGEKVASTALTQAWILIGIYELKMMYYPRVWLSTGRAIRLAQMIGMHRLDGLSSDLKQTLSPPRDWIEKEERRRTFWMAFCMDRYATVGTGWPVVIDEEDVSWPPSSEILLLHQTAYHEHRSILTYHAPKKHMGKAKKQPQFLLKMLCVLQVQRAFRPLPVSWLWPLYLDEFFAIYIGPALKTQITRQTASFGSDIGTWTICCLAQLSICLHTCDYQSYPLILIPSIFTCACTEHQFACIRLHYVKQRKISYHRI